MSVSLGALKWKRFRRVVSWHHSAPNRGQGWGSDSLTFCPLKHFYSTLLSSYNQPLNRSASTRTSWGKLWPRLDLWTACGSGGSSQVRGGARTSESHPKSAHSVRTPQLSLEGRGVLQTVAMQMLPLLCLRHRKVLKTAFSEISHLCAGCHDRGPQLM